MTNSTDLATFVHDEEFERKYPGVKTPPLCFLPSGAKIIGHGSNKSLTVSFAVRILKHLPLVPFFKDKNIRGRKID